MFSHTRRYAFFEAVSCELALMDAYPKWSGADYADSLLKTVTGGVSSTAAMGAGVTETQFTTKPKL